MQNPFQQARINSNIIGSSNYRPRSMQNPFQQSPVSSDTEDSRDYSP
jgi:hypothetical protein